ncbi:unnamed protein product, partial [Gadus morhua 'NCC']
MQQKYSAPDPPQRYCGFRNGPAKRTRIGVHLHAALDPLRRWIADPPWLRAASAPHPRLKPYLRDGIRCLTVDGAILCERRVRVQGSDMSPLRIRCMTVELSEAELILWAVTHQPAMESTCEPQSASPNTPGAPSGRGWFSWLDIKGGWRGYICRELCCSGREGSLLSEGVEAAEGVEAEVKASLPAVTGWSRLQVKASLPASPAGGGVQPWVIYRPRTVRGVLGQQVLLTGVVAGEPPPLPRWSGPGHNGPLEAGPEYTLLHKEGVISLLIRPGPAGPEGGRGGGGGGARRERGTGERGSDQSSNTPLQLGRKSLDQETPGQEQVSLGQRGAGPGAGPASAGAAGAGGTGPGAADRRGLLRRSAEPQEHVDEQQRLVEARQVDFRKLPAPHGPPGQKTPAPNEPPSLKTPAPLPPPPMAFRANLKGSGVKPRPEEEKKGPQQVDFRSILGKKTTPKKEVENTPKNGEKEAKNCVDAGRGGGGGAGAPDFKQKLSNINVLDGQKLRLQCCLLTADLRDVKVTWTLDGKVIKPSKFIVLASEGGLCSLTIEKALPEDEGQYKCRVETSLGKTETSCMVLVDDPEDSTLADRKKNSGPASESEARIKKPTTKTPPKQALPPQILQFPEDMKILAGEKVEISCRFSGAPPFSCTWLKFRKPIQQGTGGVSIESSDSSSQLIIASGQQEHCGCYTIELKNSYGLRQAALNLTIVDKPDPPAKVPAVSDVRRSTLTLSWYGPTYDGGSAVQSYNLEVWDSLGSQWRALGSCNSTSYNVQNLLPERQYKFRVRAVNIYGVGEPSVESIPVTVGLVADD